MAMKRGYREKTDLDPEEKLTAAYFYLIRGISQHDLASILGGVNSARVNEAISAVRKALEFPVMREPSPEQEENN